MAEAFDDGWQERTESVQEDVLTELDAAAEVELGIANRNFDFFPAEIFTAVVLLILGVSNGHEVPLLGIKEVGLSGVVWKPKPDDNSANDTK